MTLSADIWSGAILGAVLGSVVIPVFCYFLGVLIRFWRETRPSRRLLGGIADQGEPCKIFIRDFMNPGASPILSVEAGRPMGVVPNVPKLWADADGRGATSIFNVLGQVGKTQNIEIVQMSQDIGEWNSHVIVIGSQANKSFDFYRLMQNVAFRVDALNICDAVSGEIVKREPEFGYGVILKCLNPFKTAGRRGIGILIGGFGILGTAAAAYYFREHFRQLGREFGDDYFGIVVRAPVTAGEQAVERLEKWDRRFSSPK
jgi:hypothetical protein